MSEQLRPSDFLRRRNALWRQLRQAEPGTPAFEQLLTELAELIHWSHEQVLAGLGLSGNEGADLDSSDARLEE